MLQHHLGKKTALKGLEAIFLEERKGALLPWFVESCKARTEEENLLKLEGVDTREAALRLLQKEVWLPEEIATKFTAKTSPLSLLGYDIVNDNKVLGPVLELIEQPQQMLCRLSMEGKEVLIPLHEESLRQVDHRKKRIQVSLPDGLLELYLGKG